MIAVCEKILGYFFEILGSFLNESVRVSCLDTKDNADMPGDRSGIHVTEIWEEYDRDSTEGAWMSLPGEIIEDRACS